jgi:predicted transcriptional regulator YheO
MGMRNSLMKKPLDHTALIDTLSIVADGIAGMFGPRCEVVLHDFRDLSCSIVKILNGHVTGRYVGGCMTDFGLQILKQDVSINLFLNYAAMTTDARQLKSSTMLFREEGGEPAAALCINMDTTEMVHYGRLIQEFFSPAQQPHPKEGPFETFQEDIGATLHEAARKVLDKVSTPISSMKKEDRIKIVAELENRGFFLIKGSVNYLARKLRISKFSIYGYLEEARARSVDGQRVLKL